MCTSSPVLSQSACEADAVEEDKEDRLKIIGALLVSSFPFPSHLTSNSCPISHALHVRPHTQIHPILHAAAVAGSLWLGLTLPVNTPITNLHYSPTCSPLPLCSLISLISMSFPRSPVLFKTGILSPGVALIDAIIHLAASPVPRNSTPSPRVCAVLRPNERFKRTFKC